MSAYYARREGHWRTIVIVQNKATKSLKGISSVVRDVKLLADGRDDLINRFVALQLVQLCVDTSLGKLVSNEMKSQSLWLSWI